MSEPALQACQKAIGNALDSGDEVWGTKVRVSFTRSDTPYPYLLYFWAGGGEANDIRADDAEFRMAVKVVSSKMAEAFAGKRRISDLLNNKGEQEVATGYLNGGTDWKILTCTEEETIYLAEKLTDTKAIYHVGAVFRIAMQGA